MNALENEIIEKFWELDDDAKERVRLAINEDMAYSVMTRKEWLDWAVRTGDYIRQTYGDIFDSVETLHQLREERDDDLMGSG